MPRPEQVGQAPSGLLKEKWRGVRRGARYPVSVSSGSVEKVRSGSLRRVEKSGEVKATLKRPWPRRRASSIESARRACAED